MRRLAGGFGCGVVLAAIACPTAIVGLSEAQPSGPQGQLLGACSRGQVQVCFALLQRPRLDAGRRAAIEFHLAELEQALVACSAGDATVCSGLAERYPDLPTDLRPGAARPPKTP